MSTALIVVWCMPITINNIENWRYNLLPTQNNKCNQLLISPCVSPNHKVSKIV